MQLLTDRLTIRKFEHGDWAALLEYASDAEVMAYIPGGVLDEEGAKRFVQTNAGEDAKNYAVVLKENEKLIGHIVFHPYFGGHTYEIGWVFHREFHGRGYATEAAAAFLQYGFGQLNLHRIIATCQPENVPSWRVMEKIGMRREGFFRKCIPHRDGWWDEYYYAILREEWSGGKA
jgi:RimJ/RimL family protein N-acetyltransferase